MFPARKGYGYILAFKSLYTLHNQCWIECYFQSVPYIDLRADTVKQWISGSEIGANIVVSGTFGETHGVQIVRSKKVKKGKGFLIKVSADSTDTEDVAKYGAFVIVLKRDVAVETDRDILKKTTVITGDEHYGVYLYDPTKVVKFGGNA